VNLVSRGFHLGPGTHAPSAVQCVLLDMQLCVLDLLMIKLTSSLQDSQHAGRSDCKPCFLQAREKRMIAIIVAALSAVPDPPHHTHG
jgi:hypothetical protein